MNEGTLGRKIGRIGARFSAITPVDYEKEFVPRLLLAAEVTKLFAIYLQGLLPEKRQTVSQKEVAYKQAIAIIVEALNQSAESLAITVPAHIRIIDLGEVKADENSAPAMRLLLSGRDKIILEINSQLIKNCIPEIEAGSVSRVKRILREFSAQEIKHLQIARDYPATHTQTTQLPPGDFEAYMHDRGETATRLFGESFMRYKLAHETYPEKIGDL